MTISRRSFLMGCSAAIAAMAGGRIGQLVLADQTASAAGTDEILVMIFLRGGLDGLSLVAPYDDPIYRTMRARLALPTSGENAVIPIDPRNTFTSSVGLHAKAGPLKELYDSGALAFVHACGLNDDTRSHFDAMDYIERGTPGQKSTSTGWLTRHLEIVGGANAALPVVAAGASTPASLLGSAEAVAMNSARDYGLNATWRYNSGSNRTMFDTLKRLYPGGLTSLQVAGKRAVETMQTIGEAGIGDYTPQAGVTYPNGSFGSSLRTVAQTIKLDMGLRVATVDLGGWDTHEAQGENGGGYFANKIDELARGLHAFCNDLAPVWSKLTVVVMSEFGRRLGVNSSSGTDHGHGGVMMVMGGSVNGGKVYGRWPGLAELDQSQDLQITTDFRSVLGEVLANRLGNVALGRVFPGLQAAEYGPLGIVRGTAPGPVSFAQAALAAETEAAPAQGGPFKLFLPMSIKC